MYVRLKLASLENNDIREQLRKARTFTSDLASQRNDKVPEAQNLKLYPKQPKKINKTKTAIGDKNIADNFLHPKMHYKPIARTHEICCSKCCQRRIRRSNINLECKIEAKTDDFNGSSLKTTNFEENNFTRDIVKLVMEK